MARKDRPQSHSRTIDWECVKRMANSLPGVEESTSYGTPALKVRGKLFVRFHQDGESLVVKIGDDERTARMKADPQAFYITDHYRDYPWILVRLSCVREADLQQLVNDAWRITAPARLIAEFDSER